MDAWSVRKTYIDSRASGKVLQIILHVFISHYIAFSKRRAFNRNDNMAGKVPPKKIIETIREATGATDEDIKMVLAECNNDVNEATARLIDSTFERFRRI